MDLEIRGRVALVTGASSGIGEAVALALASEGVRLAVAARRADRLESLTERALKLGAADAAAFPADVTDESAIGTMIDRVRDAFGEVDIAVLNGGGPRPGTFTGTTLEGWDRGYRDVLRGMLSIVQRVLPPMRAKRWGRIVALTSSSVKQPIDGLVLSNSLRTALVSALRTLAVEVAPEGITVNSIATGRVDTERLRELYGGSEDAVRTAAAAEVPMRRVATPQEFAPLVAFLCGEPAGYVTGQTISIDGGLTRGLFG